MLNVNKQVVLLAAAARTAEIAGLTQDLEWAQGELGLARRHLEENKGEWLPFLINSKIFFDYANDETS